MWLANPQTFGLVQLHGIKNGGAHCRIANISPVEELIHLSLAMIFRSDFAA